MNYLQNVPALKTEAASSELSWGLTGTPSASALLFIFVYTYPDLVRRTPCGFCFVEYYTHAEALASLRYVSGTKLDERIIRCDLDLGYKEGRQFGRGKSGGQVRDEHRQDYDPGRGGWGAQAQRLEIERRKEVEERYADAQEGPGAVAGGGEDWKEAEIPAENKLKRDRSPEDEGDSGRLVSASPLPFVKSSLIFFRVNECEPTTIWRGVVCEIALVLAVYYQYTTCAVRR